MARRKRNWVDGACYHITHRCHGRKFLFRFEKYRDFYSFPENHFGKMIFWKTIILRVSVLRFSLKNAIQNTVIP
jgi:REP element-mobilizing transposase RayT